MELRYGIRHGFLQQWCVRFTTMRITLLLHHTTVLCSTTYLQYHSISISLATTNSSFLMVVVVGYRALGSFSARFHH